MYKLEVELSGSYWMFRVLNNDTEVMRGFRATEGAAHRDGSEELRFCRLFSIGRTFELPPPTKDL